MDDRPFDDPREDPRIDQLHKIALEDALEALRHTQFFHTHDVANASAVRYSHRADAFHPDFLERVEKWLIEHAFRLGLRGPLPGHPVLGARWAFYEPASDPSQ